jgi:hypothetical protein
MIEEIRYGKREGIKGDKITVQCRNYHFGKQPIQGTSRDKLQRGSLEGPSYCVIDKPVRSLRKRAQHID